jgi:ABC-type multidrug transport system ATPase subunit
VGLGYLTLNRLSNTLSGGESQRISLATSLGSALVGSMYVLDEPSIGLHPKDAEQLIGVLRSLQQLGNTVVVVEHEEKMMQAADQIIDIGPEAGSGGGNLMFQGTMAELLQDTETYTGKYLSGKMEVPMPKVRRPLAQRPGADRRPRKQPEERERENSARRDDGGDGRVGLGQVHAHQAHSGAGPDEDAGRRRGRKHRQVRPPHGRKRAGVARGVCRPKPHRQVVALEPGDVREGLRRHPDAVFGAAAGKARGLKPSHFSFNIEAALRSVPGRRPGED